MAEKSKKPAIRFAGFTEAWEQRKLDEIVSFFSGLTYSPSDIRPTGTLVLRSSNVKDGEVVDADNVYVDPSVVNSENVHDGDIIVVVRNGSRALIGKHAEIKGSMPNTVIGAFMTGIRSEHPSFLNSLLSTPHFDKEIERNMGATINQITGYMFSKMEFMIPSSKEQDAIGEYFKKISNLITLHQRKYDKLVNVKKAMLEKMFPKDGADVPEIRFRGFTEAWEQCKLSEITTMHARIGWQNLRTSEFLDNGEYMLITGTDFIDGSVNFNNCHYVKRERYVQDKNIQIKNGNILITKDGTLGKVAYIQGLTIPATLNAGVFNVEIKNEKEVDNRYLFQYLKAPFLMDYVDKKSTGGTIKHLNQNILVDFPVMLPQKCEQEKIGECFLSIDNLITLHQRKLEKLKNLKKACLEKMFV